MRISSHSEIKYNNDMDLDSMKYAELRSLAKELGLKANMKADKLLKAIKQHYQEEKNKEDEEKGQERDAAAVQEDENVKKDDAMENKDVSCNEEASSSTVFVNTRRGKRNGPKRKISDTETVTANDAMVPSSAAEDDTEVPAASCGDRASKKRKVSSTNDSNKPEKGATVSDQQPNIQDEAPVHGATEKVSRAGKIPRYQGCQQKNKRLLKPVTPNFKKLHEAHFNKMESIDSYMHRKTKQIESYRSSVKELKSLAAKVKQQQADCTAQVKANRVSLYSPVSANKKTAEDKRRNTLLSASKAPPVNKPAEKADAPFRPSVLSTRRINVRFSEATHDNEYKRSMVKTPARKSLSMTSSTPQKQATDGGQSTIVKISTFSATKTPGTFVFTGNTSTSTTPGTQKKPNFDLKASLSRPLTYKPHTGKLKPFGEAKENTARDKSLISVSSHQKNYKQHQVQTRDDRRAKRNEDRKQKKENMLGARRGLVML